MCLRRHTRADQTGISLQTVVAGLPLWIWSILAVGLLCVFVGGLTLIGLLGQKPTQAAGPNTPVLNGPPAARLVANNPRRGPPAVSGPRVPQRAEKDPEDRKVYLADLAEFDAGGFPRGWGFGKNGDVGDPFHGRIKADAHPYNKALGMHPGEHTYSAVKYRIAPAEVFQVLAGMEDQSTPTLPGDFFFEVLGDGRSLWKSKAVRERGPFQICRVKVEKVQVLELRSPCSVGSLQ